jgi:aldehyde dehydrogenase (NAD+)
LCQLGSSTDAATEAIDAGVDLIVLTGSAGTGRKVLARAAESITPSIMELSGCDAMVVLPGADRNRVSSLVRFGMTFNSSATCIAPRRILAESPTAEELVETIAGQFDQIADLVIHPAAREAAATTIEQTLAAGAVDVRGAFDPHRIRRSGITSPILLDHVPSGAPLAAADVFAPVCAVIRLPQIDQAVRIINECPYRLAASVFGDWNAATRLANRLDVGTVGVNDLIVPTGDPRLPFGGRGRSGFGVTRGPEGLLSMTAARVVSYRKGRLLPHLMPRRESDLPVLSGLLHLQYGKSWRDRWSGLRQIVSRRKTS